MKTNGHAIAVGITIELPDPDESESLGSAPFDPATLDEPVWLAKDADGKNIGPARGATEAIARENVRDVYGEQAARMRRIR